MVSDIQLYVERHTVYEYLPEAEACYQLAENYGLSYDSVRGRVSRAGKDRTARKELAKTLAHNPPEYPLSVRRQIRILTDSRKEFELWSQVDEERKGIFISDLHMPYTRWDAYELALEIAAWFKPHAITGLNDSLDNKGYGKHPDDDAVYRRLWRGDFENAIRIQSRVHADYRSVLHPDGKLLGLMGNHDRWFFNFQRRNNSQYAENAIADYMQGLYKDDGVLMFSRGDSENAIHLSSGLVWIHGYSASKNPQTLAKNAIGYFMSNGRAKSVVQGHTHRPAEVDGLSVGYEGVKFVNSGHLRNDNPDYMQRVMSEWGMGIVLCTYNPMQWEHEANLVRFVERKDMLIARYQGQEWAVKLDKSQPL